ncbi:hypothetical protein [Streptomyces shaanxiensis]|uniref:Uncharacterized protein n=1 Tax=Streptomyces shaanxiensis TaxID=653357 RepID=A0ABP7UQJ9_9ACTN
MRARDRRRPGRRRLGCLWWPPHGVFREKDQGKLLGLIDDAWKKRGEVVSEELPRAARARNTWSRPRARTNNHP